MPLQINADKIVETIWDMFLAVVIFAITCYFISMLRPLSPAITLMTVFIGIVYSFNKRSSAFMTIGGLVLYAIAWPIASRYGTHVSMAFWAPGVGLYLYGVVRTIS